ncbi:hypothetical protein [Bacteroides cellulosilyticus]|jgi:hypothetical protein|uniref:hypothetical protein n=1 Tax=Bacteroides cellulosilyticus TaxID=246787 RepID=UPI000E4E99DE|nr:hypothetical protein [Bacteroides cellulosilyticus]RGU27331.1 hypothetical protein DWW88_11090 [Bacteroides cellulosilyticus]DAO84786.1 MAG TPA: protein of unknown function (DUF4917) [Caudoviricetes sp.]
MNIININELDLDDLSTPIIPFEKRNSISFLLAAGFSAPKGYPIGYSVNEKLLKFHEEPVNFSPSGEIVISTTGEKPTFGAMGYKSEYEINFDFCLKLIRYYHNKYSKFDYEEFYDFIKSKDVYAKEYEELAKDFISEYLTFERLIFGLSPIYNQMVAYLIKDKDKKQWYDGIPSHNGEYEGYTGFLKYLQELAYTHIINVHTLNHDLFFESFNKTEYISGQISDGFDEYGSEYYSVVQHNKIDYHCRLERYNGYYNTPIRLYKLHGSLNYYLFYRSKGIFRIPDKYVKLRYGMNPSKLLRGLGSKKKYDEYPFSYHSDFLTGTTAKILRYNEPLLYRKLFKKFKKNLSQAEKLIIIGYGAKDAKINEIILKHFDYSHKKVFIVDPYAGKAVEDFAKSINAKIIKEQINDIRKEMFI